MAEHVALIVGAGWSFAAGYPLARDLIRGPIFTTNDASRQRAQAVLDCFAAWSAAEPDNRAEVFLAEVLAGRVERPPQPEDPTLFALPLQWPWAVETVMLRLALPIPTAENDPLRTNAIVVPERRSNRLRYSGALDAPARAKTLVHFARALLARYHLSGVVTTNYDLLAEQVLRHRPMRRTPEPGFYYGGLPRPQHAHGHRPWDRYDPYFVGELGDIELTGTVPICKLHGSLNWERAGHAVALFRDQRLVYRHGGTAAIIPPAAEKDAAEWLSPVWDSAEQVLADCDKWIVVGYSLPEYDYAVRDLFRRAATNGAATSIDLHDPYAEDLAARWQDVTSLTVIPRPGL
jgi:hypothetical protein